MIGFEWRNSPRHVSQVPRSLPQGRNPLRLSTCPPRLLSFPAHRRCNLLPFHPFLLFFRRHVEASQPSFPRTLRARVVLVGRVAVGLVRWSWEIRWLHAILHLESVRYEFRRDIDGNRDETDERIRSNDRETSNPMNRRDPQRMLSRNGQMRRVSIVGIQEIEGTSLPLGRGTTVGPVPASPPIRHPRQPLLHLPSRPIHPSIHSIVVSFPAEDVSLSDPTSEIQGWIDGLRSTPIAFPFQIPNRWVQTIPWRPTIAPFAPKDPGVTRPFVDSRTIHPSCWNRRGGWNNDEQEVRPPRRPTKAMERPHRITMEDVDGGNEETRNGSTVPERPRTRGRRRTMKRIEKDANRGCNGAEENNWRAWEH